jgi:hypothetical protein
MWGTHRVGPAGRDRRELCRRQWCDERQSSGSAPRSWRFTSSCWARPSWPAEAHAVHTRSAPGVRPYVVVGGGLIPRFGAPLKAWAPAFRVTIIRSKSHHARRLCPPRASCS